MEKVVRILVSGRVQGIGYRSFVAYHAKMLGLKGYVKNLDDGRVEAVFQGEEKAIEEMKKIMKSKHPLALVKKMDVEEAKGSFKEFVIEY